MSEQTVLFIRSFVARFPGLSAVLDEHTKDHFGEILPHVFFGDITRYVLALFSAESHGGGLSPRRELLQILDFLEEVYSGGDEELQELISVSFLEDLPRWDEECSQVRELVGPNLRRQLDVIE